MADETWYDVAVPLPPRGRMVAFEAGGLRLVLCNADGEARVIEDRCPHALAFLSEGRLEGFVLECPLHGGKLDVRDGRPVAPPIRRPVRSLSLRSAGERLQVGIARAGPGGEIDARRVPRSEAQASEAARAGAGGERGAKPVPRSEAQASEAARAGAGGERGAKPVPRSEAQASEAARAGAGGERGAKPVPRSEAQASEAARAGAGGERGAKPVPRSEAQASEAARAGAGGE